MADFSLTTLFVVPVGQTAVPSSGSTQDLDPGADCRRPGATPDGLG